MTGLTTVGIAVLLIAAGVALWDLTGVEERTIVVYTTPALRDVLEKGVMPHFENETGYDVALVYVAAGQQYNRLRMSEGQQEADVFLHASPLYLEKGFSDGYLRPFALEQDEAIPGAFKGWETDGGRAWYAFAWSPLVEVVREGGALPDLARLDAPFGFPHPVLSSNGIYAVLLYESTSREAGERALQHTRIQPTNARANIGGVADGSIDVTLGYEAVTRFYLDQGAKVTFDLPLLEGERYLLPVIFSAGIVKGQLHPAAEELLRFLFRSDTQASLGAFHFRPTVSGAPEAPGLLDLGDAKRLNTSWPQRWQSLERSLEHYVVKE